MRLYVHVLIWPTGRLYLEGMGDRVDYAQLLNDASEIKFSRNGGGHWSSEQEKDNTLAFDLPIHQPNTIIPVVELFLK